MTENASRSGSSRRAAVDPDLVDVDDLPAAEAAQVFAVMDALGEWQNAARALAADSARFMHLNETDMSAIRMVMRAQRRGEIVTPRDISHEIGISSASTTKLVDRLVAGGHLTRSAHPSDRRTSCIRVTESTRRVAHDTIGRQHARRLAVARALAPAEREAVIRFFAQLTEADRLRDHLRVDG
ncbi:MarR family transcriptional regulator [Leucobacter ruminantium]|uniref:MarR family transcriptional regulator n=1 Tax=Leucobacter ruminantium TaxID=1289170 RepID=A0A939LZM1_9MICO|nr:MarR family transcriptional regulator [Leucobacter ruminantium]